MQTSWFEQIAAYIVSLRAAGRAAQTVELRGYQLRYIAAELDPLGPFEVGPGDLVQWVGGKDWARETRRSYRAALRGFYGWAHGSGLIGADPSLALGSIKPGEPRPRPTPPAALLEALRLADPQMWLALRLGSEAGLRRGEMSRVHKRDLIDDLAGASLVVHGKGGRERLIPLTASLAAAIKTACEAGGGYAFPGQIDGHISAAWLGKRISRLLPEGVTPHSLRHRFATDVWTVDYDLLSVQQLLGHASPETTRRYVLPDQTKLRALVETIAA